MKPEGSITVFTRAFHWPVSWPRSNQSTEPHPIVTLFSQVCLRLPNGFLSFWLSDQNHAFIPLLSQSCYKPCQFHPPWFDHSNYYLHLVMSTSYEAPRNIHYVDYIYRYLPIKPLLNNKECITDVWRSIVFRIQVSENKIKSGPDLQFLQQWLWRILLSSMIWRRVVW